MALKECPECRGVVSSMAPACPHCGYPMLSTSDTNDYISYNGVKINVGHVIKRLKQYGPDDVDAECMFADICMQEDITDADMVSLYDDLKQRCASSITEIVHNPQPTEYNTPKCPACGSTQLLKQNVVSRGVGRFFFGAFSPEGRAQFVCQKCGYKW